MSGMLRRRYLCRRWGGLSVAFSKTQGWSKDGERVMFWVPGMYLERGSCRLRIA